MINMGLISLAVLGSHVDVQFRAKEAVIYLSRADYELIHHVCLNFFAMFADKQFA